MREDRLDDATLDAVERHIATRSAECAWSDAWTEADHAIAAAAPSLLAEVRAGRVEIERLHRLMTERADEIIRLDDEVEGLRSDLADAEHGRDLMVADRDRMENRLVEANAAARATETAARALLDVAFGRSVVEAEEALRAALSAASTEPRTPVRYAVPETCTAPPGFAHGVGGHWCPAPDCIGRSAASAPTDEPERCESCGREASVTLPDGSHWCASCDGSAQRLGYSDGSNR